MPPEDEMKTNTNDAIKNKAEFVNAEAHISREDEIKSMVTTEEYAECEHAKEERDELQNDEAISETVVCDLPQEIRDKETFETENEADAYIDTPEALNNVHDLQTGTGHKDQDSDLPEKQQQQRFNVKCEPCKDTGKDIHAKSHCVVCDETLCDNCTAMHRALKATKSHALVELIHGTNEDGVHTLSEQTDTSEHLNQHEENTINRHMNTAPAVCNPCSYKRKAVFARKRCRVCMTYLCAECTTEHRSTENTRDHTIDGIGDG